MFRIVEGEGEPLLLCNGIAMSAASWEPIARPLSRHYRVVRFDFRGQLMSPGEAPRDAGEHVTDVVALLDELEIDRANLVATSFGGAVAAMTAARHPERVRSLVSVASADGFDDVMADEVARWRQGCVDSLEGDDRGLISDVLEPVVYSAGWLASHRAERSQRRAQIAALPRAWFEGLIGLLDSTDSVVLADELGSILCPTLIVAAELDGFIPIERTRALADGIHGARFEVIEDAGHAVVVERHRRVVELCSEFLDSL